MSLLNFFKKIKGPNDRWQDLGAEDTFVLAYCCEKNTLSVEKIQDLRVEKGCVHELIQKDLEYKLEDKSYYFLFVGNRLQVEQKYEYLLEKAKKIKGVEEMDQNPNITSSQEVPNLINKDLIMAKLDQIKLLVCEIETLFDQNQRIEEPEVEALELMDESSQSLPMCSKDLDVKDKEISLKKGLIKRFEEILHRKRYGNEGWTRMVNSFFLPDVPFDKMKGIQKVLTCGRKLHGYVVREIAKILFGVDRLKITKIVNPRSRSFKVKKTDRKKLFSKKDEENLRSILNLIDKDLFSSSDGWYYLAILPINQCGLDIKRDEKKKELETLKRREKKTQPLSHQLVVEYNQLLLNEHQDLLKFPSNFITIFIYQYQFLRKYEQIFCRHCLNL